MNEGKASGWRKNVIADLEAEYGDLHAVIPKLVNLGGQTYAAFQLGTTATTISRWLKANGYVQQIRWIRATELEAVS